MPRSMVATTHMRVTRVPRTIASQHVRTNSSIVGAHHVGHVLLCSINESRVETVQVLQARLLKTLTASYTANERIFEVADVSCFNLAIQGCCLGKVTLIALCAAFSDPSVFVGPACQ